VRGREDQAGLADAADFFSYESVKKVGAIGHYTQGDRQASGRSYRRLTRVVTPEVGALMAMLPVKTKTAVITTSRCICCL
jgi:hypothetical protein